MLQYRQGQAGLGWASGPQSLCPACLAPGEDVRVSALPHRLQWGRAAATGRLGVLTPGCADLGPQPASVTAVGELPDLWEPRFSHLQNDNNNRASSMACEEVTPVRRVGSAPQARGR